MGHRGSEAYRDHHDGSRMPSSSVSVEANGLTMHRAHSLLFLTQTLHDGEWAFIAVFLGDVCPGEAIEDVSVLLTHDGLPGHR